MGYSNMEGKAMDTHKWFDSGTGHDADHSEVYRALATMPTPAYCSKMRLKAMGESFNLPPRVIGTILRRLNFKLSRDRYGTYVLFSAGNIATLEKAQKQGKDYPKSWDTP